MLLDPDNPLLQQLMQQLAVSPEQKRAAQMQALAMTGFGMMGARKGQEGRAFGNAAMGGMNAYQNNLAQAQQDNLGKLRMQQMAAKMQEEQRARQAQAAYQKELSGAFAPQSPLSAMGPGGPTPQNAQRVSAASQGPDEVAIYRQASMIAARNGRTDEAKKYADMADSIEKSRADEYGEGKVVMRNGKPVLVRYSKKGQEKVLEDVQPTPDLQVLNLGGKHQVVDKYGLTPGQSFDVTMTPAQIASNDIARGQLAVAQGNLGLSRERLALDKADKGDGRWVNDLERGIQVNMATGESRPITAGGQAVGAKGESKNRENAGAALDVVNQAEALIDKATDSYAGAGIDQAARVFGASTPGADAIAQLQALEGALMLRQPRMEGPQSDKDVAMYKQMAGKIGDPTVPAGQKKAALKVIRKLHERYAGSGGSAGGWSVTEIK